MRKQDWHKAIDEATEKYRRPTHDQIIEVAKEIFPQKMKACSDAAEVRGLKARIRDAMRQMLNVDESRNDMDVQTILPGMTSPSYIGVPGKTKSETCPVKITDSRPTERKSAINQRKLVRDRIQHRIEDMETKENFLDPYIEHDFEKLSDTLETIKKRKKSA